MLYCATLDTAMLPPPLQFAQLRIRPECPHSRRGYGVQRTTASRSSHRMRCRVLNPQNGSSRIRVSRRISVTAPHSDSARSRRPDGKDGVSKRSRTWNVGSARDRRLALSERRSIGLITYSTGWISSCTFEYQSATSRISVSSRCAAISDMISCCRFPLRNAFN